MITFRVLINRGCTVAVSCVPVGDVPSYSLVCLCVCVYHMPMYQPVSGGPYHHHVPGGPKGGICSVLRAESHGTRNGGGHCYPDPQLREEQTLNTFL